MNLKELMIDTKSAWISFPGLSGFEVEVVNLSRKELNKLRKRCTTQKFDRKSRQVVDKLDEDKFVEEFADASVKNWKGLTLDNLEQLILIDTAGKDLAEELPYSKENAELLIANSSEFDGWLNDVIFDMENFRSTGDGDTVEEVG